MIANALESPDSRAMLSALGFLGAHVKKEKEGFKIYGVGGELAVQGTSIHVGNSGLALRFLTAAFALGDQYMMITGDDSIRTLRPMDPLITALNQMGAFCIATKNNGFAPIIVRGPIHPHTVVMDGRDSQPVSALLMAASFLEGVTEIEVKNPKEKAWVDLTLHWLERFSVPVKREGHSFFSISGARKKKSFHYFVPGDMSSMAFPLAAALIAGENIVLEKIAFADLQGDKKLISIVGHMGANLQIDEKKEQLLAKKSRLSSFCQDADECIDALPISAVLASYAKGKSYLTNASGARNKESNRLFAIAQELRKMGAIIEEKKDSLTIEGVSLKGAVVESHKDHRIAMALTVAALGAKGETIVKNVSCVEKSYPKFFEEMIRLGADITFV